MPSSKNGAPGSQAPPPARGPSSFPARAACPARPRRPPRRASPPRRAGGRSPPASARSAGGSARRRSSVCSRSSPTASSPDLRDRRGLYGSRDRAFDRPLLHRFPDLHEWSVARPAGASIPTYADPGLGFATAADALGGSEVAVELAEGSRLADLRRRLEGDHPALAPLGRGWRWRSTATSPAPTPRWPTARRWRCCHRCPGERRRRRRRHSGPHQRARSPASPTFRSTSSARSPPSPPPTAAPSSSSSAPSATTTRAARWSASPTPPTARWRPSTPQYRRRPRGRSPALRATIVHRLGEVPVGDPSVVIAVASPHRAAAYEASRTALERLKQEAPIWKREHYAGGASRWREEEPLVPEVPYSLGAGAPTALASDGTIKRSTGATPAVPPSAGPADEAGRRRGREGAGGGLPRRAQLRTASTPWDTAERAPPARGAGAARKPWQNDGTIERKWGAGQPISRSAHQPITCAARPAGRPPPRHAPPPRPQSRPRDPPRSSPTGPQR